MQSKLQESCGKEAFNSTGGGGGAGQEKLITPECSKETEGRMGV